MQRNQGSARRLAAVVGLLALGACGAPQPNHAPVGTGAHATKAIGASGGDVSLEGTQLDVPAGAVPDGTSITVTSTTAPAPDEYQPLSPVYQFEPEGLQFSVPATITMPLPAKADAKTVIYWSTADGKGFEALATTKSGQTLQAAVTHFSQGFVGEDDSSDGASSGGATTCSVPDGDCGKGCSISCSGDTVATCTGAGGATDAGVAGGGGGGSGGSGGAPLCASAPSCSCQPIQHTCSAPANAACGDPGCSITCTGDTPVAVCSATATSGGGAPNGGTDDGGSTGGGQGGSTCGKATCSCAPLTGSNSGGGTGGAADGGSSGVPDGGFTCQTDSDCGANGACIDGACASSTDGGDSGGCICPDGSRCDPNGVCAGGGQSDGGSHTGCATDGDCPTGMRCDASSGTCAPVPCTSDDECASGLSCINSMCQPSGCTCADGTPCDANGSCSGGGTTGGCGAEAPCPNGMVCDASTGKCLPASCGSDADCSTGLSCIGGRCQPSGCTCADGTPCDAAGSCGGSVDGGTACDVASCQQQCSQEIDPLSGSADSCDPGSCRCVPPKPPPACSDAMPCPGGMQCLQGSCRSSAGGPCQSNSWCVSGICDATTGSCR